MIFGDRSRLVNLLEAFEPTRLSREQVGTQVKKRNTNADTTLHKKNGSKRPSGYAMPRHREVWIQIVTAVTRLLSSLADGAGGNICVGFECMISYGTRTARSLDARELPAIVFNITLLFKRCSTSCTRKHPPWQSLDTRTQYRLATVENILSLAKKLTPCMISHKTNKIRIPRRGGREDER